MGIEFRVDRESFSQSEIHVRCRMGDSVMRPAVFTKHESGSLVEPMLQLKTGEAQQLMDELWRCGLRPTEGVGSAGSLLATQEHLSDLRKIAFSQLKIK